MKKTWIIVIITISILVLLIIVVILCLFLKTKQTVSTDSRWIQWNPTENEFQNQNKQVFFPVGFNAHWFGLIPGTPVPVYPARNNIESAFLLAKQYGSTVIRSITLGFSVGTPNSLLPQTNGPINEKAWEPIDTSIRFARQHNIYLIPTFLDPYDYYTGNMWEYLKPYDLTDKKQFYTDPRVRQDFKNYLRSYLNHSVDGIMIKDEPMILMLELGNELDDHGYPSVPNEWLKDIASYIRSIDKKHLLLAPMDVGLSLGENIIDEIDVYSQHYYNYVTDPSCRWCMSDENKNQLNVFSSGIQKKGKAYIIGEFASCYAQKGCDALSVFESYEIGKNRTVQGDLFWEYVYDGAPFGTRQDFLCQCKDDGDYQDIDSTSELWDVFQKHWNIVKSQGQPPPSDSFSIVFIGDSITAGYNCGVTVPGKGTDQCTSPTKGRTCDGEMASCDFAKAVMVTKEQISTDSFFSNPTLYFPNCSLSYTDFIAQQFQQNGYSFHLYNMGISGAQAGGCFAFNQSYKNGGQTAQGQSINCWDSIFTLTFQKPIYIVYMLGTNDAIKQYVDQCFEGDIEKATTSYFASVVSMLQEIIKIYSDNYLFVVRPIKNYAYQYTDYQFFYTDMINDKYAGLEKVISDTFASNQKIIYIDLFAKTKDLFPENESLSYLCDYVHPMDNLNSEIGKIFFTCIEPYLPKSKKQGTPPLSTFYKCSI